MRTIALGHDQVELAGVEVEMVVEVVMAVAAAVGVRRRRSGEAGEAQAKVVSGSMGAVEQGVRKAAVEVEIEAEAGVEARLTGVVLGVVEVGAAPRSVEVVGFATLQETSGRSARTQS